MRNCLLFHVFSFQMTCSSIVFNYVLEDRNRSSESELYCNASVETWTNREHIHLHDDSGLWVQCDDGEMCWVVENGIAISAENSRGEYGFLIRWFESVEESRSHSSSLGNPKSTAAMVAERQPYIEIISQLTGRVRWQCSSSPLIMQPVDSDHFPFNECERRWICYDPGIRGCLMQIFYHL
jgi:hypothetical protein